VIWACRRGGAGCLRRGGRGPPLVRQERRGADPGRSRPDGGGPAQPAPVQRRQPRPLCPSPRGPHPGGHGHGAGRRPGRLRAGLSPGGLDGGGGLASHARRSRFAGGGAHRWRRKPMKKFLMVATAACALTAGLATATAPDARVQSSAPAAAAQQFPATPEGARAFVEDAEARLADVAEYAARVAWVRNTYIIHDTMWLEARANTQFTELGVELANAAARFNDVQADPVTRRKLDILRQGLTLPSPNRPGAAAELSEIATRLDSTYATGKFQYDGRELTLNDAEVIIAESRDPEVTRAMYEGWRTISPVMRDDYARLVEIANEGARELGFADTGAMWRSGYDMDPDAFAAETDRLWEQVRPFYENLHCYVRARLNERYGDAVQPATGPIRADLLGNMWSQQWGNIYDVVAPRGLPESTVDLTQLLVGANYDAEQIARTSERFYTSIGLD